MKLDSLHTLFVNELSDLYSAETQLIKALPKLVKGAHSRDLQQCFKDHLEETKGHVERLEQIFKELGNGSKVKAKTCKAMEGLIKEGSEQLKATGDPAVIDAALIAAAQRVEHYEIAGYGCVCTFAGILGLDEAKRLLEETLQEEKDADEKLTDLATGMINEEAAKS